MALILQRLAYGLDFTPVSSPSEARRTTLVGKVKHVQAVRE